MQLIGVAVAFVLAGSLASFAVEGQQAAIRVIGFLSRVRRLMRIVLSPDRRLGCRRVAIEDSTPLAILVTLLASVLVDVGGSLSDRRRLAWRSGQAPIEDGLSLLRRDLSGY
jgi:hypothetical protein